MVVLPKRLVLGLICTFCCFCASCMTMTLPQSTKIKNQSGESPKGGASRNEYIVKDDRLCDTWELMYLVNDKGEEKNPDEGTRTLMEFTQKGEVIVNKVDRGATDRVKTRNAEYLAENNLISITDQEGNKVTWPYMIDGDTLIIEMPEVKKKFYWRRFR